MKRRHLVRLTAWITALSMAFSMAGNVVGISALTSDNNDSNPTIVYADSEDETPEDETPEDETPEDETPENETPEDETLGDEIPEDETPGDETPEDEIPATPEPIITHYVQEVSGEGLIPYEYYSIDYGDTKIDDSVDSCVYARSYNYTKSIYGSLDGYNALTAEEKQIYSSFYEALEKIDNSAAYDAEYDDYFDDYYFPLMKIANKRIDEDTLFKVYLAVSDDNPQFFWKGHGYYWSVTDTSTSVAIRLDEKCVDYHDGSARMAVKEELMSTVNSVLVQAERYGNDYSKEWYVHNYLCEVNTYDLTGPHAHDVTGVLLDGRGVCESYAKCFQMFMNALDIDVLYVTGTANGGGHAWNQIVLDGEWYNVDVTWDDNKSGGWNYYYFNVVDSDGSRYDFINGYGGYNDHTAVKNGDREYVYPTNKCTATKYAYKNHETNFADSSAVAHVGKNYFDTLDDAIASIKTTGKTIELLNNAEYNGTTMPSYPFTIECNGFSVVFNEDMILKSNVTIKNISGTESSPENISSIIVGAYTLNIGVQPTSGNKTIFVNVSGGTTPKGTVNITSQGYICFDLIENITTLNLCENAVLLGKNGISCTNLILNNNSLVRTTFNEIHVTNLTAKELSQIYIDSNDPLYHNKVIIDGTATLDDTFKLCVGVISYSIDAPLLITKNKYPSTYFNVFFNSDDTPVSLKRTLSDGMYYYTPVDHPDFSIYNSSGICIAETASVGEAFEYIDSLARTTETYTIYYTGSDDSVTVDGSDLSVSKAKEVIFAGAPYEINNALTLKTNLTFKSGATFKGELTTGTFALTLDSANAETEEKYIIYPTTKSPNIIVKNSELTLCGGEETTSKIGKVTLVNSETTCSKLLSVLTLDITDSSIKFSGDDCLVTIGSIKSTGENIISLSGNPSITLTGTVTLTDSKPIEINNPVGNTAENGATVITAPNTAVKPSMFKTTAKTPSGLDLNIIRNDKKIQFAAAVFKLEKDMDTLGTYSVWTDVIAAINAENDAQANYRIMLLDNAQVKTLTLPAATKCESISFDSSEEVTLSVENDITLATDTCFFVKLRKVDALTGNEKPLNFTIGAKELTLKSINEIGNISGTGIVNIGDAKISGVVNIGGLLIQGKVTLGENASLTVKSISQSNPTDRLVYPYQNVSKIKIGRIDGTLVIEMTDGVSEYSYPTNKPFDLFNVTTGFSGEVTIFERDDFKFVVSGTKMVAINADSTYRLYLKDDETDIYNEICECISYKDAITIINSRSKPTAEYMIVLPCDESFTGALPLPAAGKYKNIYLCSPSPSDNITISVTSDLTLTGDLILAEEVLLKKVDTRNNEVNLNINLGKYSFNLSQIGKIGNITGTTGTIDLLDAEIFGIVNVKNFISYGTVVLDKNASFTATTVLGDTVFEYPYTSASKINIGTIDGDIAVILKDGSEVYAYPENAPFNIMNIKNNYVQDSVTIYEKDDYSVVRSGSKLVAGKTDEMFILNDGSDDSLFSNLKDIMTEINRLNNPSASYIITVPSDVNVTGVLPLPTTKKYSVIAFKSKELVGNSTLSLTGDINLTGNVEFMEGVTVKKVNATTGAEVPLNINLGTYSFVAYNTGMIGTVRGSNNSCFSVLSADISGAVNVDKFNFNNKAKFGNNASLTAKEIGTAGGILEYPYKNALRIKTGTVEGTVKVRMTDGENEYAYPTDRTFDVMNITGDYVQDSVKIYEKDDYSVVRSGSKLVAGKTDEMFILNDGSDDSLFSNLKDIMTEINRLNNPSASYIITVPSDVNVTGVLPLPTTKKYSVIAFKSKELVENSTLSLTGDINLTGNVEFMEGVTVKKVNATTRAEVPLNINLGTYSFVAYNTGMIGTVRGSNNSCFSVLSADISGAVNVDKFNFNNKAKFGNNASLTAKEIGTAGGILEYPYKNALRIKTGTVEGTVKVRMTDGENEYAYPIDRTFDVMNITGDYVQDSVTIYEKDDYSVVRSGTKLIATKSDGLYILGYDNGVSYTESEFIGLKDIMTEINRINNPNGNYLVKLPADENITGALPLPLVRKYKEIAFDSNNHGTVVTISVTSDLTLTGNLRICDYATIRKVDRNGNELPINLNVGAYSLSAMNIGDINNITASNGKVWFESENISISGTANIGTLQCSKTMTLGDRATLTVKEYKASQTGAKLIYPYKNVSKIKIETVSAKPVTIKLTDGDGDYVYPESNFDILNITGNYYDGDIIIDGCSDHDIIRSGNKLIAVKDADIIVLNDGNGHDTSFMNLKDIMTDINRINELAKYSITIPSDMEIKGALPLPAANKYYLIAFEGKDSNDVTLSLTGDINLTGNVEFMEGVTVKKVNATTRAEVPLNINLGTYSFVAYNTGMIGSIRGLNDSIIDLSSADISGTVSVDKFHFDNKVTLGNSVALTTKYLISENGILEYPYKNALRIKTGTVEGTVKVRMTDGENRYVYPTDRTFDVINITGDYVQDSVTLDKDGYSVVRSGTKLIATKADGLYILGYDNGVSYTESEFISLKDIMTEINRLNNPSASYIITVPSDVNVTGVLPLPTTKKYSVIAFKSKELVGNSTLSLTGDINLTGNVEFMEGVTVKKVNATTRAEVPLNINLGTYEMSVFYIGEIGRISGAAGKVNFLRDVKVSGTVNAGTIKVGGRMALENNASLTAANVFTTESGIIDYKLKNASRVKINTSDCLNIKLLDDNGTPLTLDETYANKVLIGKYTGDLGNVHIDGDIPEGYVLEKTSTNAVILKKNPQ